MYLFLYNQINNTSIQYRGFTGEPLTQYNEEIDRFTCIKDHGTPDCACRCTGDPQSSRVCAYYPAGKRASNAQVALMHACGCIREVFNYVDAFY